MSLLPGLAVISFGSLAQSSSYVPLRKVRSWSWESYWLVQAFFAYLLFPLAGALMAVPDGTSLFSLYASAPLKAFETLSCGVLWGIGGLTFGLSIRYLGVALGQSIALGTCSALGAILGPLLIGHSNELTAPVIIGVIVSLLGIAVIGIAGMMKSKSSSKGGVAEFNFSKGIAAALLSGLMSACFNVGLNVGDTLCFKGGSELLRSLPATLLVTTGGFLSNLAYCFFQNARNRTWSDYGKGGLWARNSIWCALAGFLWYSQFFGLSVGKGLLAGYPSLLAFSWCILMSLNVIFSNLWGLVLGEWRECPKRVFGVLSLGIAILLFSIFLPQLI